jgi:hypothetical protein
MPVSFVPVLLSLTLLLAPAALFIKSRRAGTTGASIAVGILFLVLLRTFAPGGWLLIRAALGSLPAQYEFARWRENYSEEIGNLILWPCEPDVLGGFASLSAAAAKGYVPAIYAVGVRLKYGDFVPRPEHWDGPGGNVFPQPELGQRYIDDAIRLGYAPTIAEERFYWQEYRGR